jgi:hypothetical protein
MRILTKITPLLMLALSGCEVKCRDTVAVAGRRCPDAHLGAQLVLERTSPLAPPVAVCRCPVEIIPEKETK